jgi:hypothetical protein
LTSLPLEVAADLEREDAHLVQRPRPVGQARVVAEVDEVLVRHRHEALVQNREPPVPESKTPIARASIARLYEAAYEESCFAIQLSGRICV